MKLSPKQVQAIVLLAAGTTSRAAAEELSISPQTISEWKRNPAFIAQLNDLQVSAIDAARTKIQQAASDAVDALRELVGDGENPEIRRKAANDILRLAGFEPSSRELYRFGVGPTTVPEVEKEWRAAEYHQILTSAAWDITASPGIDQ
jgi:hypothetical protein